MSNDRRGDARDARVARDLRAAHLALQVVAIGESNLASLSSLASPKSPQRLSRPSFDHSIIRPFDYSIISLSPASYRTTKIMPFGWTR
jgi:hypothetical protein